MFLQECSEGEGFGFADLGLLYFFEEISFVTGSWETRKCLIRYTSGQPSNV